MSSVCVGVPVWNGAAYLEDAIRSLLEQTVRAEQIIIAVNASSDDSADIAEGLAAAEPTVSVVRRDDNIGASGNYNDLVERAETDLFAWLPHDDRWTPGLLGSLKQAHEEPGVAVAYGDRRKIGPSGAELDERPVEVIWSDHADPIDRLRELFQDPHHSHLHDCSAGLGLVRRDVLSATGRVRPFSNSDKVLIVELALYGRLVPVDAVIERRVHEGSSLRTHPDDSSRRLWFDPTASGPDLTQLRLLAGFLDGIRRSPLSARQRRSARRLVAGWAMEGRRPRTLGRESLQQAAWLASEQLSRLRPAQPSTGPRRPRRVGPRRGSA